VRRGSRIVSVASIIAIGVNADRRREVLGLEIGTSEAEPIWTEFLRKLTRRGIRGVKLVVSDAHESIKTAVSKVLNATWQHCRVHFMRNALAHAEKSGRRVVSAFIATAFAQDTPEAASSQWRSVADQIRPKVPKLANLMDQAENDVLAYMTFPRQHWTKLHSTNPIERLNGEIKRRTECSIARSELRGWPSLVLRRGAAQPAIRLRPHPQGQTATATKPRLVLLPVRHFELHLADTMPTGGIVSEWYSGPIKLFSIAVA